MSGIKLNHRTRITLLNTSPHKLLVGPVSLTHGESKTILLDSVPLSRLGRLQRLGHLEITQVVDEDGETIASVHPVAVSEPAVSESAVPEPAVSESAVSESAVPEPAVSESAVPEPAAPVEAESAAQTPGEQSAASSQGEGQMEAEVDPVAEFAALAPSKVEAPAVVEQPAAPAEPSPEEVARRRDELGDLKVAELRAILVERGQKTDDLRKPELIDAIIATDPKS